MNLQQCSDLAQDILKYLASHPDAQDTLEGIAWLPQRRTAQTVRRVRGVLQELVSLGLVVCKRLPDGRACYRFNRRKALAVTRSARPLLKKT